MKTTEKTIKITLIKTITVILITFTLGLQKVSAQDYMLNFSDPTTYYITCGRVNAGLWSVKNDSCMLFTPFLRVEVEAGATVSFIFRVNQSGNGDQYDKGYIYHSIDAGDWVLDQSWTAGGFPAVYTFETSIFLEKDHFVQFMIRLCTNNKTEFWGILNGNISATDNNDASHNVVAYDTQPPLPDLPVQLISFNGKSLNGSNMLEWTTASETNNDYFVIERSEDGIMFNEIGEIGGAGNSNSLMNYEFEDSDPPVISYYRLRQVDFDGNFTYSPVIELSSNSENDDEIQIFSTGSGIAVCANAETSISPVVTIYNMTGQIVYSTIVTIQEGASYLLVTPDIATEGLYLVNVISGNQVLKTAKIYF